MKRLIARLTKKLAIKLGLLIYEVNPIVANMSLPKFGNTPKNIRIDLPRRIINPERIFLGDNVSIGPGSLLIAITQYPTLAMQHPHGIQPEQSFDPKIVIGSGVSATANLQLAAYDKITIEDDVMFASNINITDGLHAYETAHIPYKYQGIFKIAPITVKKGCWIGQNVVILPGVTIGEFSIIAANSVVTKNIPNRCIAAGSPAEVIKKWDEAQQGWVSVTNSGE
jgi:acetyltransferase-like isoleucine patch superfamily enzyme